MTSKFLSPRVPPLKSGVPLRQVSGGLPVLKFKKDKDAARKSLFQAVKTKVSLKVLKSKLNEDVFAKEDDEVEEMEVAQKKSGGGGAAAVKDKESSSDSGSTSSTTNSSECEETPSSDEVKDEYSQAMYQRPGPYQSDNLKNAVKIAREMKLAEKLAPPTAPLFTKPLELCEAELKYLEEKSGNGGGKKVIRQTQEEYKRNMAAFHQIRKKDWEKRRERREQRRIKFQMERDMEELQEGDEEDEDEEEDEKMR